MDVEKDRVTIFDVAEAAEVSISTVSRVMNGNYPVKDELRDRVNKAVKNLGYMPDSVARGMKSKRRYAIGLVVSDITNRHFTVISKAIDDLLSPQGYSLIVCNTDSNREREARAIRMLLSNRIDGLIINTSGKNDSYIASISKKLPVVLLHRHIDATHFHGDYVGSDNYHACAQLAMQAVSAGHRDMAIITSDRTISTFNERTQGFIDTLKALKVNIDEEMILETPYTEEGGYDAFGDLISRKTNITLLVIMNNATAIGAIRYAKEHGIQIPEEVSLLSFGDILNANLMFFQPTFIAQKPVEVGIKAAQLILDRLDEPDRLPEECIINTQIEQGNSLRILTK